MVNGDGYIDKIDVSVLMVTYKHEKYIHEAITGILNQKCDYNIELIIADDCSPDKTNEIVEDLIKKHPNGKWIKYTKHLINKGANDNFLWALSQCNGRFVALCEGDDYWIDIHKLQRQISMLETNENIGGVSENSIVLNDDGSQYFFGVRKSRFINTEEMILCRQFSTASFVFRLNLANNLPEYFREFIASDTPLMAFINDQNQIYYNDIISSVYRRGKQGVTASFKDEGVQLKIKNQNNLLNAITNQKYSKQIQERHIQRKKIYQKIDYYFFRIIKLLQVNKQSFSFDTDCLPLMKKWFYLLTYKSNAKINL